MKDIVPFPLNEYRDHLVLELYGRIGLLRDVEAMEAVGEKLGLGPFLDIADGRLWLAKEMLLQFVDKHPEFYEETYRALHRSRDLEIAKVAENLKAARNG